MEIQQINNFLKISSILKNGNGDGDGNGYGNGYGYGTGISYINKQKLYLIDNCQTILSNIKNNVAKGFILLKDLTLEPCYIVKNDNYFAHGKTIKEALKSLEEKTLLNLPIEKRIESFKNVFKDFNKKQKASLFYDWHFKLTGSCNLGRDSFCKEYNINLSKDKFTVYEFIELTKNNYNGDIIKQLLNN